MATIGSKFVDLIDVYKSQDPNGQMIEVIDMLTQENPVVEDAFVQECNKGTTHMHTVTTGLPAVTWGQLYKGVDQSKSRKASVEDTTGFVEGLSTVDERVLNLSPNPNAIRLQEATEFLEAMKQEVATKIFYGNSAADPEQFMGLAPRFNSKSAANGSQIIDAGGTGTDNTSIWFVTWGPMQCQLLYPKGTQAGVNRQDMGRQRILDASGNPYYAMEEKFTWHVGMAVKDWRYVARVANIDVSNLKSDPTNIDGAGNSLYDFMRRAYYRLQNIRVHGGRLAIYCNRDVFEALDAISTNSGSTDVFSRLKPTEVEGKMITTYRGIPLRMTDAILNTEARVV